MDPVLADRLQFAFTIMFHYLFPIGTMGLAPFVAAYTWKAARNRDEETARIARFWTRIFAINFAAGVVTGIPMEFQFGTNWAAFSRRSGAVVGQPLAMESMFAFFLESVFLAVLLYRRRELPTMFTAWSAVLVCAGSWLSGFFIVATDAWMQHPVGYAIDPDGTIRLESIWAVLSSPFLIWQFLHVLNGALLAGGFIVMGVGAYYLLSRREEAIGRRFVRAGVIVGFIFSLLAIFPTGDRNGRNVTTFQPIKL
ncbi:MAG: cytochrome ubiquinol oxidase subunit I, partial [Candidatus Cybelea sp.]